MIFSQTWHLLLTQRKRRTLRLVHQGDSLGVVEGKAAVFRGDGRVRWCVGGVYAVQQERCHHACGHIAITEIQRVDDPTKPSDVDAADEGFASIREYLDVWHALHQTKPVQPCWALYFKLVSFNRDARAQAEEILRPKPEMRIDQEVA